MNRLALVADTLVNIGSEILKPEKYPYREVKPTQTKYWLGAFTNILLKSYLGAEYIDAQNIPETGPAIIAANHFSHLDGPLINAASAYTRRRAVVFLVAADLYKSNWLFRTMCDVVNCIPIKRNENDRIALLKTIRLLHQERLLGIFPEGQRSRDGNIGKGKSGVALITLATGCPVIPVGITGTFEAFPRKNNFIKPAKVRLKFGTPLWFGNQKHPSDERISWVRDKIMSEIKRLHEELHYGKKQKLAA
ncbi:MAG: 1-acyl-sn-glycerol-3-phosphate acyltransferase [Deltaproteobacteria bacterium]|nr:1-acyl-sn-glycerol-3-phosphate acyltransferase [Deltaproteobacteria bacterium]